jgi:cation diffusion facilitator CzcD-associated flavoprotein CzcO
VSLDRSEIYGLTKRAQEWTNFYATQPQIETYYTEFAKAYGLDRCTQFRSFVKSCTWDDERLVWHVEVEDRDGQLQHWIADVVCQCVGSLDRPKFGNTPGRENFKGASWHTAHWRHDYDLRRKNVAIIGCGPSAAQIIPEIVDKVGHLTVYMRTPPVCGPRGDFQYSKYVLRVRGLHPSLTNHRWFRFAISWIPFFAYLFRQRMNVRMMLMGRKMATDNTPENDRMTKMAVDFMESQIKDPKLREIVRPYSKCPYFPLSTMWNLSNISSNRLLQAPPSSRQLLFLTRKAKLHRTPRRSHAIYRKGSGLHVSNHRQGNRARVRRYYIWNRFQRCPVPRA